MQGPALKFVIVGHVDHGKSTLIGRLLYDTDSLPPDKIAEIKQRSEELGRETEFAYLLDHLEEERRQGITIETTQTFFKSPLRQYVIIDAPGHVEFVKNMVTGASQAEAAVLIVDVKEGVKEQTKRHAYILSLLGLKQVVVVLNKMDMVGFERSVFESVKKETAAFLASINIEPLLYIPISAIKGENIAKRSANMPWYSGQTFLEGLDLLKNSALPEDKPLLFPIQDVYKVDDKRISAGRLESGRILKGQEIRVLPGDHVTRIGSIERFPDQCESAEAGSSIGITTQDALFLKRGDVVCAPGKEPLVTDAFKASIFWMSKRDFDKNEKIVIRCATQETTCKIESIAERIDSSSLELIEKDASTLKNLEVGEVIIKTKRPIVISSFNDVQELGRFVLEKNENICAGGIISSVENNE